MNFPKRSEELNRIISAAFSEDVREGDHTSLSCIGRGPQGLARLIVKEDGILAGMEVAKAVFDFYDPLLEMEVFIKDGTPVKVGDVAFHVKGSALSILTSERITLNLMQRMSGIATKTNRYVQEISGTSATVIDTRKTTPGIRMLEKWAVAIGGGGNHRMGLYDMIMIKDNHVDFCGGIEKAINAANNYLAEEGRSLKIEIETRSLNEVQQVLDCGNVDRIMLDNFSPALLKEAVELIGDKYETEASGGITLETIRSYAETGVRFISSGALTHSAVALDMSLKAVIGNVQK
ncbi:MAG: carboxylating nicotinate-nucleotide diphosphorylase [Bacteroidetes bacterium]|nr:carboxylating nicotinate-nucleotide diphosphorylase [Bacteroidota bacterium]